MQGTLLLEQGKTCYFDFSKSNIRNEELPKSLQIAVNDILGNKYIIDCYLVNDIVVGAPDIVKMQDGSVFNIWQCQSKIQSISLPRIMKEQPNE